MENNNAEHIMRLMMEKNKLSDQNREEATERDRLEERLPWTQQGRVISIVTKRGVNETDPESVKQDKGNALLCNRWTSKGEPRATRVKETTFCVDRTMRKRINTEVTESKEDAEDRTKVIESIKIMGQPILDFDRKTIPEDYEEKARLIIAETREYSSVMNEMRTALNLAWVNLARRVELAQEQGRPLDNNMIEALNNVKELMMLFDEKDRMIKEATAMWEQVQEKKDGWKRLTDYYKITQGTGEDKNRRSICVHGLPTFCKIEGIARDREKCHICAMRIWSETMKQIVKDTTKVSRTHFQEELGIGIQKELQTERKHDENKDEVTKEGVLAVWTDEGERKLIQLTDLKMEALKQIEKQPGWVAAPIEEKETNNGRNTGLTPYIIFNRVTGYTMTGVPELKKEGEVEVSIVEKIECKTTQQHPKKAKGRKRDTESPGMGKVPTNQRKVDEREHNTSSF